MTTTTPSSFSFPLYVRSVYLLYTRGKWQQLNALGANRAAIEPGLQAFVSLFQQEGARGLEEDAQIVPLLCIVPQLADLAVNLMGREVQRF